MPHNAATANRDGSLNIPIHIHDANDNHIIQATVHTEDVAQHLWGPTPTGTTYAAALLSEDADVNDLTLQHLKDLPTIQHLYIHPDHSVQLPHST